MRWAQHVTAIIQAWLPGQEAGYAIADVILGNVNPGGKLPVTFPKRIEDAPTYDNFPYSGRAEDLHVDYDEDVFVGYRHYDRAPDTVLFPFGYGLSYTAFKVSRVTLSQSSMSPISNFTVSAMIQNTGAIHGSETLQVYVGPHDKGTGSPVDRPNKVLAGFAKAKDIAAQQMVTVTVLISVRESFSYWHEPSYAWFVPKGKYNVIVATSSAKEDIKAQLVVEVTKDGVLEP